MVNHRDPDRRRGLDQPEHLPSQHLVPARCQSRLGCAGHHVAQMEPVDSADRDHFNISTSCGADNMAMKIYHVQDLQCIVLGWEDQWQR